MQTAAAAADADTADACDSATAGAAGAIAATNTRDAGTTTCNADTTGSSAACSTAAATAGSAAPRRERNRLLTGGNRPSSGLHQWAASDRAGPHRGHTLYNMGHHARWQLARARHLYLGGQLRAIREPAARPAAAVRPSGAEPRRDADYRLQD